MTGQPKFFTKKHIAIAVLLTLAALGGRLFIALKLPNDAPDDGRLYARIARNMLDQRVYTIALEEPYSPTYIRLPGYPVFLAAVYKLFGHDNNTAVRVVQAFVDTLTCWLVAGLALAWTPTDWDPEKRRRALLIALALAVSCPFLAIYVGTILTEIWTAFLATLCALAASLAMRSASPKKAAPWWVIAGLAGGIATMFRPDAGLFVAAVGGTMAVAGLFSAVMLWRSARKIGDGDLSKVLRSTAKRAFLTVVLQGCMLTLGFGIALAPWTIRNARVFGIFMPLAPAQANMADEFVPRGFILWLRTWVDDVKYTEKVEWAMDDRAIHIDAIPPSAFDSDEERDRVADLLAKYNREKPPPAPSPATPAPAVPAPAAARPPASAKIAIANANRSASGNEAAADAESKDDSSTDAAAEGDSSGDDDSGADDDQPEPPEPPAFAGEMTPDIDAGFMEIAREHIARHPFRFYVVMPARRAASLWFDPHAQYYPFDGELLPLKDLDHDLHQEVWLPLFVGLTWIYTILAIAGAWVMWRGAGSQPWLLMSLLWFAPRIAFLSTLENPEPRYVVVLFTFVMAASSLAFTGAIVPGATALWHKWRGGAKEAVTPADVSS